MVDSLKLNGRRMVVMMTRKMPSENNDMRRNFLASVSHAIGDSDDRNTYSPSVCLILSKAGIGSRMRTISVNMLSAPTVKSCPIAWEQTPKLKN